MFVTLNAWADGGVTAKAFLQAIYAPYTTEGSNSLAREHVYSQPMLKLMARDTELAGDEVGYLNGDPLCDCQDYAAFRPDISVSEKLGKATANITFKNGERESKLALSLVQESGQWRVDDVVSAEGSLREALRKSNKNAAKKH